jgi:type IV secretion system protein TrbL
MSSVRLQSFMCIALPFLVLLPSVAFAGDSGVCASSVGGEGILSGLAQQFQMATTSWAATALAFASNLFFALVAIEMAWSGVTYVLQKDGLPEFFTAIALKLLSVGFFLILLQPEFGSAWINDIIASFMQAGSAIGGQPLYGPNDPSAIFNCGTDIAGAMITSLSGGGVSLDLLGLLEAYVTALVCALGVVLAFAVVAGQLLVTLIESYIVIGGGLFFLGFTGSRWTLVFGEKYLGYIFSVGTKLFMLELIVGLGYGLGQQWAALFTGDSVPPATYIEVVGAALVFGFVAWQIPGLAASLMNGAPRMTLGSLLSNIGTMVVGGAVAGGAMAGIVAGAKALAGKGIEALKNAAAVGAMDAADFRAEASGAEHLHDDIGDDVMTAHEARSHVPSDEKYGAVSSEEAGVVDAGSTEERYAADASDSDRDSLEDEKSDAPPAEAASESEASSSADAPASDSSAGTETAPTAGKDAARKRLQDVRPPPVPDDSADGSIHIRFKHPE